MKGKLKKMKKLLTVLAALAVTTSIASASAGDIAVNVVSGSKPGSNTWKVSNLIRESLDNAGIKGELVTAGSCHKQMSYVGKTDTPTVFLHNTVNLVSNSKKGCSIEPTEATYVAPIYTRGFALCSRKTDKSFKEFVASVDSIIVSTASVYGEFMFKPLEGITGKPVKYVPKRTSDAIKAVLAGDVNLLYSGYTPSVAKNTELTCWGTTYDKEVNGIPPLTSVLPTWKYSNLSLGYYIYGDDVSGETKQRVRDAILKGTVDNSKLAQYIASASMIPGNAYADKASVKDFWDEYAAWTAK